MEIKAGMKIDNRYQVVELIGEGGMANVYLAEDIILMRPVAVKVLHEALAKQERFVERFRREAEAVASLIHPHIVEIYDVGEQDSMYFIVMELLEGKTLKEYVRQKHFLSVSETISIMRQACQAVELAHKNGIIHRDLKPQNIFIKEDGTIKIMDFGIAYQQEASPLTQTNAVMGSVHYLSPEQAKGENATVQTDIYSLGIVMYEMLTGDVPFTGESAVNIVLQHLREAIPYVSDSNMHIPQSVENIVIKATAKNAADRYKNLAEMKVDLDTCLNVERMNEPRIFFEPSEEELEIPEVSSDVTESVSNIKPKKKKLVFLTGGLAVLIIAILIFLGSFLNSDVLVPELVNKTEAEAKIALELAGLKLGKVESIPSDTVEIGKIIKADKEENTKVKKEETINITVSKGKQIKMPSITGIMQAEAEDILVNQGIKYKIIKGKPLNGEAEGIIINQSVAEGMNILISTDEVEITVAENEEIRLENLEGYFLSQAKSYASERQLELEITEDFSESVAENKIIFMPDYWPGKTVKIGDTIKVVVSKGPKPVEIAKPIENEGEKPKPIEEDAPIVSSRLRGEG
ncbi:serine/threonine protein kinase [Erysipelotrichaceae bacterium]|nr:serine/threonine protein kinase [Erysipelotrichaceae bacterium]